MMNKVFFRSKSVEEKLQTKWFKTLWHRGNHNAFTDLCEFNGSLYCCFREATDHVSQDGKIRVVCTDNRGNIRSHTSLMEPGVDLRDPKLSVTPDGNMMLMAYARHTDAQNKTRYGMPVSWTTQNGKSWSTGKTFGEKHWWLWRLRWHRDQAYGFAYNRQQQSLHLYKGNPRRTFQRHCSDVFSLAKQGLGYPNETDLAFDSHQNLYCLLRRDADSFSAQLGYSKPPYKRWYWRDLGEYIGGPAMLMLDDHTAIVAGRRWDGASLKTAIWKLDLRTATLRFSLALPSSGDNSYPGLVRQGDEIFVSYYSSHTDNKSAIYLAKLSL